MLCCLKYFARTENILYIKDTDVEYIYIINNNTFVSLIKKKKPIQYLFNVMKLQVNVTKD